MRDQVLQGATVRVASMLASYVAQYFLILHMTRTEFGGYSFIMSLASIAAMAVALGHPQVLLRFVANQMATGVSYGLKDVWRKSHVWAISTTCLIVLGGVIYDLLSANLPISGYISLVALMLLAGTLLKLNSSLLYGANLTTIAQFAETVVRPSFLCILLFSATFFLKGLTVIDALFLNLISYIFAYFLSFIANRSRKIYRIHLRDDGGVDNSKGWFSASLVFSMISSAQLLILSIDTIIIGWVLGNDSVAIYRVASLVTLAIGAIEDVVGTITRPMVAAANGMKKLPEALQRIRRLSFYASIVCLLCWIIFLFFGKYLIFLVFGGDYIEAYSPTLILIAGAVLSVTVGPIGLILSMTNNEKTHLNVTTLSLVVNIVMNVILIPFYGITGAAIAYFLTIFFNRLLSVVLFKRLSGITFLPGVASLRL